MSLKVWQRQITTPQGVASEPAPAPEWLDDVPRCTERCPHHDGKRCRLMGFRPGPLCEPAVEAMARLLNEEET